MGHDTRIPSWVSVILSSLLIVAFAMFTGGASCPVDDDTAGDDDTMGEDDDDDDDGADDDDDVVDCQCRLGAAPMPASSAALAVLLLVGVIRRRLG